MKSWQGAVKELSTDDINEIRGRQAVKLDTYNYWVTVNERMNEREVILITSFIQELLKVKDYEMVDVDYILYLLTSLSVERNTAVNYFNEVLLIVESRYRVCVFDVFNELSDDIFEDLFFQEEFERLKSMLNRLGSAFK